ncbi:MAG: phosphosulfolactate synthase [Pseudonocardiales bacterium]|nr:phosphosulfolactate synthase [Pseudonocardiales bacterium]
MQMTPLTLPVHESKPRRVGLTMAIDTGLPTRYFQDLISSFSELIDVVKFGWGTSLVTADLKYKIDTLADAGVEYYFGGTMFETFVLQDRFDDWRRFCDRFHCRSVEVSNGTIPMSNTDKAEYVARLAGEYRVYSEVGFKDSQKSEDLSIDLWLEYMRQDFEAGAAIVITEARESGRAGICLPNGDLRVDLIDTIGESGIDIDRVMFEAPNKELQVQFIRRFGPGVNLGNVNPTDIVGLETLRLGLRGDTLLDFADDGAVLAMAGGRDA